jgi:hypothetical protein
MVASPSTAGDGIDDNSPAFSASTGSSAVKDRRIIDLDLQLRRANTSPTPPPTGGVSAFPWRGGGVRGSSRGCRRGGGRCGRGGSNKGDRSKADGPENMSKNSRYWNADTYCWTCGYDSSKNNDCSTCTHQEPGHESAATVFKAMGGSIKEKEYSRWN